MKMASASNLTGQVIGLDVGTYAIKAAQIVRPFRGRHTRGAAAVPACTVLSLPRRDPNTPLDFDEAMRLRKVLDRQGFRGRRVVVCVPSDVILTSVLELPPRSSGAPLQEIARAEMARVHRLDPEGMEVAFWDLPQSQRQTQHEPFMAAACRHDHAEALIAPLAAAGFDLVTLDMQGWAVARALTPVTGPEELVAVVDIGYRAATFILLYQRQVVYQRCLPGCGDQTLVAAVASEQGFEPQVAAHLIHEIGFEPARCAAEEDRRIADKIQGPLHAHFKSLADELRLSIAYAAHQYPQAAMTRLLLLGGGARIPGLTGVMDQWLEVNVAAVGTNQIIEVDAGDDRNDLGHAEATALGVAVGLAAYTGLAMAQAEVATDAH